MKVLSLFDGMSCAQIAISQLGIDYTYDAAEIDKWAIKVTQANFTETNQLGDITKVKGGDYDLIVGGSPCQGFSFAGKGLNFDDPRSKLFFEYVRILKENKDCYFLLENVRMKKEFADYISELLGVEYVVINSALVSAQNRVRYYWTNIPNVNQPADKGIVLSDILEDEVNGYGQCGAMRGRYLVDRVRQDGKMKTAGLTTQRLELRKEEKTNTLTSVQKDNYAVIREKSKCVRASGRGSFDRHEWDSISNCHYRKLTPLECERLQTVPDNYTAHVSNTQRYKMLGNGFTVDVIKHILKEII